MGIESKTAFFIDSRLTIPETAVRNPSITMLATITAKIRPPRALSVPYELGFPLGEANNPTLQTEVLRQLLALLQRNDVPVLEELRP